MTFKESFVDHPWIGAQPYFSCAKVVIMELIHNIALKILGTIVVPLKHCS